MNDHPYAPGASSNLYYDENGSGQCQGNPRMSVQSSTDNGDGTFTYTIRVLRVGADHFVHPDPAPLTGVPQEKILHYVPTPGPGNDL